MGSVKVLFFASLREALGISECRLGLEELNGHGDLSVATLRQHLVSRGGEWRALEDTDIKVALNQSMADLDRPLQAGDELAFFPPVTGG